ADEAILFLGQIGRNRCYLIPLGLIPGRHLGGIPPNDSPGRAHRRRIELGQARTAVAHAGRRPVSGRVGRCRTARKYIATYIVLTMRHRRNPPSVVASAGQGPAEEWRRLRARLTV